MNPNEFSPWHQCAFLGLGYPRPHRIAWTAHFCRKIKIGEGMSNIISIQQFLVGKALTIPLYQRDYSWTTKQVEDLFGDVAEAIATTCLTDLGTVVLAGVSPGPYEVVDGQQRLSTLALIIHALLAQLPNEDTQRIADTAILLRQGPQLKLDFGNNAEFVASLLSAAAPLPNTAGHGSCARLTNTRAFARRRYFRREVAHSLFGGLRP